MRRKMRLSTLNVAAPLVITSTFLVLGLLETALDYRSALDREARLGSRLFEYQKQILRATVSDAVSYIRFRQSYVEEHIRSELRSRVDEAFEVARRGFERPCRGPEPGANRERVVQALASMRYGGGRGHYFVYSLDGREVVSLDEEDPADGETAANRQRVIGQLARIARTEGEGFYSYLWPKPDAGGTPRAKLSFVRRFEPYGWFIGTGEYVEDIEAEVKRDVLQWLSRIRFAEWGYIWVHDNSLRMVSHPYHTPETDPAWYRQGGLHDYADARGVRVFLEMQRLCQARGGGFVDYLWEKPGRDDACPKLSYVELVPEWNWILGAGIYTDDVQAQISVARRALSARTRRRALGLLGFVVGAVVVSVALTHRVHRRIGRAFRLFDESFREAALTQRSIDPRQMLYAEFSDLSVYVNQIVEDRRRAHEQKRRSDEQLLQSQKMEAIGKLAAGIAHDFSNLLSAMSGFAEMGLMNAREGKPAQPALEEILKHSRKAIVMTGRLRDFSRKDVVHPEVLPLNDSIRSLHPLLRRLLGDDIGLVTDLDPALGFIEADRDQVERAIVNLATNARDAMPGGGTLRIATRNVSVGSSCSTAGLPPEPGDYVRMEVADTGEGMDEKTISHLFEPFFTTKEKGTGLGLSTVYGMVRQSHGHIAVESERLCGTTFRIYLPFVRDGLLAAAGR